MNGLKGGPFLKLIPGLCWPDRPESWKVMGGRKKAAPGFKASEAHGRAGKLIPCESLDKATVRVRFPTLVPIERKLHIMNGWRCWRCELSRHLPEVGGAYDIWLDERLDQPAWKMSMKTNTRAVLKNKGSGWFRRSRLQAAQDMLLQALGSGMSGYSAIGAGKKADAAIYQAKRRPCSDTEKPEKDQEIFLFLER